MAELDNTNLNDKNLEEETEDLSFITMVDDQDRTETFEYLGEVEYDGKVYIAVLPVDEETDEDGGEEVFFLEVEDDDEKGESYISVDDDDLLDSIYEAFKAENSDIYDFE